MTKMHLPPPSIEKPPERSVGFIVAVLLFSVSAAVAVYFFL